MRAKITKSRRRFADSGKGLGTSRQTGWIASVIRHIEDLARQQNEMRSKRQYLVAVVNEPADTGMAIKILQQPNAFGFQFLFHAERIGAIRTRAADLVRDLLVKAMIFVGRLDEFARPFGARAVEDEHDFVAGFLEFLYGFKGIGHAPPGFVSFRIGQKNDCDFVHSVGPFLLLLKFCGVRRLLLYEPAFVQVFRVRNVFHAAARAGFKGFVNSRQD